MTNKTIIRCLINHHFSYLVLTKLFKLLNQIINKFNVLTYKKEIFITTDLVQLKKHVPDIKTNLVPQ